MKDLTLPEFAFIEGSEHQRDGNQLQARTVIIHNHTATVIEVIDSEKLIPFAETITHEFIYTNIAGIKEPLTLAVHYAFAEDVQEVLKKAAEWYCEYCQWEDGNIADEYYTDNN